MLKSFKDTQLTNDLELVICNKTVKKSRIEIFFLKKINTYISIIYAFHNLYQNITVPPI